MNFTSAEPASPAIEAMLMMRPWRRGLMLALPEKAGWEWIADPSLAAPVREVIRIYRGERTATFVPLPVTLR